MAEVATMTEEQVQTQVPEGRQEITVDATALAGSMFGIEIPKQEPAQPPVETPATPEPKVETPAPVAENEEILDPKDWLKREFEVDDPEVLKQEIKEYRELKEKPQTAAEIKFENDNSKRIYELLKEGKPENIKEVRKYLETQEKLESLVSSDINDENAPEVIKMGMKLKYPDLTEKEIEHRYNKQFSIPKEPVQGADELDDEFSQRKAEWNERVQDIKMELSIEAKLSKPELLKAKAELVLPEISGQNEPKPPTQEELEAAKRYDEAFIQSIDNSLKDFNGFSVKVKNDAVGLPEISIAYSVIDNEKTALSQTLKDFAQAGYDTNALFAQRWVNEDRTLNTKLIAEDRYWLENRDKIVQKMTAEAATKAIEAYVKGKKNININETSNPHAATLQADDKTEMDLIRDKVFG